MNFKLVFYNFEARNITEFKEYLNEMSRKGWVLDGTFLDTYLSFKKTEKKNIKYLVTLQEKTKAKEKLQSQMIDFEKKGYNYIDCMRGIVVYCAKDEYEKVEELEKNELYSRMHYYTGRGNGSIIILWWLIFSNANFNDTYRMYVNKSVWIVEIVCLIGILIPATIRYIENIIWKRKITKCIEENCEIEKTTLKKLKRKMLISKLITVSLCGFFIISIILEKEVFSIIYIIGLLIFVLLINLIQTVLKKKYKKENKLIPGEINFGAMIIFILFIFLCTAIILDSTG
ncbi:MAG: DUF2812 domain-containing protein [Sarcina sp.]